MLKKIGYGVLIAFIAIQFIRTEKNINLTAAATANNMSKVMPVPDDIQTILKTSCYDCHSNNTIYPWYAAIQPVAWWLNDHIEEAKKEINFNEFAGYSLRRQYKKLGEIIEQLKEDEMPLNSYRLIHRNAVLNEPKKLSLLNWAQALKDTMLQKYPADSLKKKQ